VNGMSIACAARLAAARRQASSAARLTGSGAEVAKHAEAALADHALRRLGAGDQDTADLARLVPDWAVGEGEVRLLHVSEPIHLEQEVVRPGGLAGLHHVLVERSYDGPDVGPALAPLLGEGAGVFGPQNGPVAVVVDLHQLQPPPDVHREGGLEADPDRRAQALGPGRRRTERRPLPVERPNERAHLAAPDMFQGTAGGRLCRVAGSGHGWLGIRTGLRRGGPQA
jgi:hypothetical protein